MIPARDRTQTMAAKILTDDGFLRRWPPGALRAEAFKHFLSAGPPEGALF